MKVVTPTSTAEDIEAVLALPLGSVFKFKDMEFETLFSMLNYYSELPVFISYIQPGTDLFATYGYNTVMRVAVPETEPLAFLLTVGINNNVMGLTRIPKIGSITPENTDIVAVVYTNGWFYFSMKGVFDSAEIGDQVARIRIGKLSFVVTKMDDNTSSAIIPSIPFNVGDKVLIQVEFL